MQKYFKADAKAEGDDVTVAGYEVIGEADLAHCRWFAFRLNQKNAPWAFAKQGEAYRAIASLELFASLLCIMLFIDEGTPDSKTFLTFTGISDNKGNEGLVRKHMTSKFPLYLVLLELTEQLLFRRTELDLKWQAREFNQAADDLSNFIFKDFSLDLRLDPKLDSLPWLVLPKLLHESIELHRIITERKASSKMPSRPAFKSKKRKAEGLKTRDPW